MKSPLHHRSRSQTPHTLRGRPISGPSAAALSAAGWMLSVLAVGAMCGGIAGCTSADRPKTGLSRPGDDPSQPIARAPGSRRSTDSRVIVSIRPIGSVPFDGMTLPLTSPNGRFIATQSGSVPSFAVVLGEPGATVPPGLKITAAAIPDIASVPDSANPDQPAMTPLPWSGSLPRGLLLGRSCDDRGFLVESPQPDGSRRIGMVDWRTGRLTWLVDAPGVIAAFATLGPNGELAYARRVLNVPGFSLALRTKASDASSERVLAPEADGESLVCPVFSADPSRVYVFRVASREIPAFGPLTLLSVAHEPSGSAALAIAVRTELGVEPTPAAAFQAVAPLQSPWPLPDGPLPAPLDRGIAIADLTRQSMLWVDGVSGERQHLARLTAGAAPLLARAEGKLELRGMLLGTAKELVFQPYRSAETANAWGSDAGVVSGPFIPRLAGWFRTGSGTTGPLRPVYILLSPPKGGIGGQISVVLLTPVDE